MVVVNMWQGNRNKTPSNRQEKSVSFDHSNRMDSIPEGGVVGSVGLHRDGNGRSSQTNFENDKARLQSLKELATRSHARYMSAIRRAQQSKGMSPAEQRKLGESISTLADVADSANRRYQSAHRLLQEAGIQN